MFAARQGFFPPTILPTGGVNFEKANNERILYGSITDRPAATKYWVCSAWIKPNTLPTGSNTACMFGMVRSGDGNSPMQFELMSSNRVMVYTINVINATPTYTAGFKAGQWYNIVAKANGSSSGRSQIWINGERIYDAAATNSASDMTWNSVVNMGIGARAFSTLFAAHLFDGCIDQIWMSVDDIDLDANIGKFYNNGYVDMGTTGTASGLPTPDCYFFGNTIGDFDDQRGDAFTPGTTQVDGTISACS